MKTALGVPVVLARARLQTALLVALVAAAGLGRGCGTLALDVASEREVNSAPSHTPSSCARLARTPRGTLDVDVGSQLARFGARLALASAGGAAPAHSLSAFARRAGALTRGAIPGGEQAGHLFAAVPVARSRSLRRGRTRSSMAHGLRIEGLDLDGVGVLLRRLG
jgi:hypothetical protein